VSFCLDRRSPHRGGPRGRHGGASGSLSAWVNDALERQAAHERRLRALDEFFGAYEREHGEITVAEMEAARRRFTERALVVRGAVVREASHEGDAPR